LKGHAMDKNFSSLVDHRRIVEIDSDTVPAFPPAPVNGESLFVNCHYDTSLAATPRAELLEMARLDALEICRRLPADERMKKCAAAVVTVYGHFPVPGGNRPARRRIYRVAVLSQDLRSNRVRSPTFLSDIKAEESSELDDVADLLHPAAP